MSYNFLGSNSMVESGGGTWHPERGPYGAEFERSDVFGHSRPLTEQITGNMYSQGPSYLESQPFGGSIPDIKLPYEFEQRARAENEIYARGIGMTKSSPIPKRTPPPPPPSPSMGLGSSSMMKEGFAAPTTSLNDIDYDIVDEPETSESTTVSFKKTNSSLSLYIFLFLLLLIVGAYWIKTTDAVMMEYIFHHIRPTTFQLGMTTLIMTCAFSLIVYLVNRYG